MIRYAWALAVSLGLCAPALAEEPAPAPVPPQQPAAPALAAGPGEAVDEPVFSVAVLPLPFVAIYSIGSYENFRIGPTRHDVFFRGGYVWATNLVYDPNTTAYKELAAEHETNFWNVMGHWDWKLNREWALLLDGYMAGGGVQNSPGYDQALTQGLSTTWGPALRYSSLDSMIFPLSGFYAQGGWAPGMHWGAENLAFHRAMLDIAQFVPLGGDQTIMLRASGKAAWPKLAWVDKFYAGGAFFVRGYQWNRFTGDRLLSATAEYRNLFAPDLLGLFGLDISPKIGLGWEAYVDGGRVWESTVGVPFLSDLRWGGGTGLLLTVDKAPLGRTEISLGSEGPYFAMGFGASF